MFFLVVRKEIVHNIYSFRFVATYALLCGLVLLAMFLMSSDYRSRQQVYTSETARERARVDQLKSIQDPSVQFEELSQTHFAGIRPPQALSILARGLDDDLPTRISARNWLNSGSEQLLHNLLFQIFQTPDFVYVINIVTSLLALLFVFDSICGEKEAGTLKLLLSNSVPRDIVLAGKWIGGYLSVVGPFSVAVLGGLVYIHLTGALELGGDSLGRFGLIYLVSLMYISVCFTLGLLISTLTHRASTALLVCLLVWIGWILVVPTLAPLGARLTVPVPSRQVIVMESRAIEREAELLVTSYLKRVGDESRKERKARRDAERAQQSLEEFYQKKVKAQVLRTQNLARLSPSSSFVFAATRLAGTGPELSGHFLKARDQFRESYDQYMKDVHDRAQVDWTRDGPMVRNPDWFNPGDVPRFHLFEEALADSFDAASFDMLLLVVFNVLFFMLSYAAFLRYDIT